MPLFFSEMKYEHGTGWPSFTTPVDEKNIAYRDDYSLLAKRIEVRCSNCGAHLGHVFDDGPGPTFLHYCVNSAALDFKPEAPARPAGPGEEAAKTETATFAAGCFWGVEYKMGKLPGVVSTMVGYTGGKTVDPTYEEVCSDRTGHAEAVQLTFDPARSSYADLVRHFFSIHDPTQVNRQGPDQGSQYRSAIFYHSEEQKKCAEVSKARAAKLFEDPIVTQIVPLTRFYPAENYHQDYYRSNPHAPYCLFVIRPKLAKLRLGKEG
jgi:peptide methionine sulfoxide reductase msrA/msrB